MSGAKRQGSIFTRPPAVWWGLPRAGGHHSFVLADSFPALTGAVVGEFREHPEFLSLFGLIPSAHARHFHSLSVCDRHHHPARYTRWSPLRCCGVRFDATSTPDSE